MRAAQKCKPGCTCKRHSRVISKQHRQNIAKANAARKGESHKCPPNCTCNRHKASYTGGSRKGRTFSAQAKKNMAEAARHRTYAPDSKERLAAHIKAQRSDPEWEQRRVAALREALTGTTCPDGCMCEKHSEQVRNQIAKARTGTRSSDTTKAKIGEGSRAAWARKTPEERSEIAWQRIKKYGVAKVSQHEYALAPYLAALGFKHNDDRSLVVGRKFPDFFDEDGRRLFEYFGNHWHPRPQEEAEVIDYYRARGWECTVLWEADILEWMLKHKDLVTEEQYQGTRDIARNRRLSKRLGDLP